MMTIHLNNEPAQLPLNIGLKDALVQCGYNSGSFAVALNQTFIPKSAYEHTILQPNDVVEIVAPMQGG